MSRRLLLLLDALCVAACAILLGHAAALALTDAPSAPRAPARAAPARVEASRLAPEAIAGRNLFCSTCPVPGDAHGREATSERRRSALPLVLVAVNFVTGARRDRRAIAIIRHAETGSIGAFPQGAAILGARITVVRSDRVDLDNDGVPEFLDLVANDGSGAK